MQRTFLEYFKFKFRTMGFLSKASCLRASPFTLKIGALSTDQASCLPLSTPPTILIEYQYQLPIIMIISQSFTFIYCFT